MKTKAELYDRTLNEKLEIQKEKYERDISNLKSS